MRVHFIWLIGWMGWSCEAGLTDFLPSFIDFEQLIKAATDTCERLPLHILFTQQFSPEMRRVELLQYSSEHPGSSGVVIYVPGWWNTPTDESSQAIIGALLNKYRSVMLLDTQRAFCRGYLASAARVKPLAHQLYKVIRNMMMRGVPLESIHVIGFSLGAHVAGMTGKLFQKNMNRKLSRITALDPAKPCFTLTPSLRVDRRDARFVHVVHTSPVLGIEQPLGHADVYVPASKHCQGKRSALECEHAAAWRLYSLSVMDPLSLMSPRCGSWRELVARSCSGEAAVMGDAVANTTRGLFLFSSDSPSHHKVEKRSKKIRVVNPLNPFTWLNR